MGWECGYRWELSGWTVVRRTVRRCRYEFVFFIVTATLFFNGTLDPLGRERWPCPRRPLPTHTATLMSPLSQCTLVPLRVYLKGSPTQLWRGSRAGTEPVDGRVQNLDATRLRSRSSQALWFLTRRGRLRCQTKSTKSPHSHQATTEDSRDQPECRRRPGFCRTVPNRR